MSLRVHQAQPPLNGSQVAFHPVQPHHNGGVTALPVSADTVDVPFNVGQARVNVADISKHAVQPLFYETEHAQDG